MWCSSYNACFIRIITNIIATEDISFLRYMFLFISRVVLNCTRNVPLLIYIDREFISVDIFSLSSRANTLEKCIKTCTFDLKNYIHNSILSVQTLI